MSIVAELLARCRAAGVSVEVNGDRLRLSADSEPPADLRAELRRHKAEIMASLAAPAETEVDPTMRRNDAIADAVRSIALGGGPVADDDIPFDPPQPIVAPFDQPCPERRGLVEWRGAAFVHFCPECGRWGSFGYGTTGRDGGRWYCREHRPEGE